MSIVRITERFQLKSVTLTDGQYTLHLSAEKDSETVVWSQRGRLLLLNTKVCSVYIL